MTLKDFTLIRDVGVVIMSQRDALVENLPVSATFAPSESRKLKPPKRLKLVFVSLFFNRSNEE